MRQQALYYYVGDMRRVEVYLLLLSLLFECNQGCNNVKSGLSRETRWGKNPHFIQKKNSHIDNRNFYKIHLSEFSIFTKFTLLNSQFSQNSHF